MPRISAAPGSGIARVDGSRAAAPAPRRSRAPATGHRRRARRPAGTSRSPRTSSRSSVCGRVRARTPVQRAETGRVDLDIVARGQRRDQRTADQDAAGHAPIGVGVRQVRRVDDRGRIRCPGPRSARCPGSPAAGPRSGRPSSRPGHDHRRRPAEHAQDHGCADHAHGHDAVRSDRGADEQRMRRRRRSPEHQRSGR